MIMWNAPRCRQVPGKFPSICMNRNGTILEAHQPSSASTIMYYQVGKITGDDVTFTEIRPIEGTGKFPKVAINDDNQVVEVHEAVFTRNIYYNVGVLNDQRVKWQSNALYVAPGRFPSVAVRGRRVLLTYDRARLQYTSYYQTGTINERGSRVDWNNQMSLPAQSRFTETSVAINDEFAVVVGNGWFHIVWMVGRYQDNGTRIDWVREVSLDSFGGYPAVSLDDAGRTIMLWQTGIPLMKQLVYAEGRIVQDDQPLSIRWEERRSCFGCYPTVTLSPHDGNIVEEHETNIGFSLYSTVGKLNEHIQEDQ